MCQRITQRSREEVKKTGVRHNERIPVFPYIILLSLFKQLFFLGIKFFLSDDTLLKQTVPFNQMGIDVLCGAYLGMDVRQIIFLIKPGQIAAEGVRSHRPATYSSKHIEVT